MTLVDTNVLIDILSANTRWRDWSVDAMERRSRLGPVLINDIVYAELAAGYGSQSEVDDIVKRFDLTFESPPRSSLYRAGRAFARYCAAGGPRTSLLPDFFIGAHAAVAGVPILTRDVRRYRAYFPDVALIAPDAS